MKLSDLKKILNKIDVDLEIRVANTEFDITDPFDTSHQVLKIITVIDSEDIEDTIYLII